LGSVNPNGHLAGTLTMCLRTSHTISLSNGERSSSNTLLIELALTAGVPHRILSSKLLASVESERSYTLRGEPDAASVMVFHTITTRKF